ncbi:hypothetical protein FA95DRAFT_1557665, partial [Auriscalpium vulgare]
MEKRISIAHGGFARVVHIAAGFTVYTGRVTAARCRVPDMRSLCAVHADDSERARRANS